MINVDILGIYDIIAYKCEGELRVDTIVQIESIQRAPNILDCDRIFTMHQGDKISDKHIKKYIGNLAVIKEIIDEEDTVIES